MSRYIPYNPEQVWLLPPSVREELGEDHLAVFVHELVERLDLREFEAEASEQGRLGRVAIDSTRIAADASPDRSDTVEQLRRERARIRQQIRRWQKQCERDQLDPTPGPVAQAPDWQQRLEKIPRQLEQLRKSGQRRGSRCDPESRYLRQRGGFCLGYTAEVAVRTIT